MSANPRVSVIIPTYGRTDFLSAAIDSVYEQSFSDFELLVVDDNDPGNRFRNETKAIVDAHKAKGQKFIYVQHDKNRNGAAARNTGFQRSSGEFISFLDSDDEYLPDRLAIATAILEDASQNVGGVYTGVEFRRNKRTYNTYRDVRSGRFLAETLACKFMLGTGSNLFIRRSVLQELQGFDESFQRHQDYEFLVRFFQKYELAACEEVLVIKNNENFNLPCFSTISAVKENFFDKYRTVIKALSSEEQDYIFRCNYVSLAELALMEGLRTESKKMYTEASFHGKLNINDHMRRYALWALSWVR